jgi:hypothetical protein
MWYYCRCDSRCHSLLIYFLVSSFIIKQVVHCFYLCRITGSLQLNILYMATKTSDSLKFIEALVTKLLLKESTPLPKIFCVGKNIEDHMKSVERYISTLHLEE